MFSLGEFVDGPYNKVPTIKTSGSRRVYNKFMHIFDTNKVPPSYIAIFMDRSTFMGGEGTNVPQELGTTAPPSTTGPVGAVGAAGVASPARCGHTCPVPRIRSKSSPSSRAQLGWTRLIKETSVWSNGSSCDHLDQWVHLSGRSTTITIIPRPSWASLGEDSSSHSLEVGRPHLPTAVPNETDSSYRPSTALGARIRSVQVMRRWIIGPIAPPHPVAPMKMGPRAQPTSLTYKRSLTPAGLNTQRWSISLPLFC
jgi:hypothetical protein